MRCHFFKERFNIDLPRINVSDHKEWPHYFDRHEINRMRFRYKEDFELWEKAQVPALSV